MAEDNPLETFRHALAGATRAMARDAEVELGFTSDMPGVSGKSVKAPMPASSSSTHADHTVMPSAVSPSRSRA